MLDNLYDLAQYLERGFGVDAPRYMWGGRDRWAGLNGAAAAAAAEDIAVASSVVSRRYIATCLLIVELRGPLSCCTAAMTGFITVKTQP